MPTTNTATTDRRAPVPVQSADQPQYTYAGGGRFLPANDAAHLECARWNAFADRVNARTARSNAL